MLFPVADAMAIDFLYASVTSLLAGIPVWLLLSWSARRRSAIAASRSLWLLAQGVILAALVVALLPGRAQFSVLPSIEVDRGAAPAAERAPQLAEALAAEDDTDHSAEAGWLTMLARAWLILYAGGVAVTAYRTLAGRRRLAGLLRDARLLDERALARHGAFAGAVDRALPVWETDAPVSPMLVGLVQPCLVLPRHLRNFPLAQQQLIVAHELTHLQRRDPLWLHMSMAVQTLLWFNPLLRQLGQRLRLAQELGCDRQVLAGRPQPERQQYAAALVAQLKMQLTPGVLAFGEGAAASLAGRIGLIRAPATGRFDHALKVAVILLLAAVMAASAMLQPAFAWRSEPAPAPVRAAAPPWQAPLADARVSSFFGVPRKGLPAGHGGIDFAARTGTPVLATADGVVVTSTDHYEGGTIYGKVVVIEHPGQVRSVYAHLDQRTLAAGASVKAGQQIGTAGETGKATGPHLHLEAWQHGQRIDPARLLAGLDERAFPKALAKRAAAGLR